MIYFAPEAGASYLRLGLRPEAGYFASRSAAMGAVEADTVIATFFNFHPGLVRDVIPEAWEVASPAAVLTARLEAADAALGRMLGDAVDSPEMERAAALAREAAERAPRTATRAGRCSPPTPAYRGRTGLTWCSGTPRPSSGNSGGTGIWRPSCCTISTRWRPWPSTWRPGICPRASSAAPEVGPTRSGTGGWTGWWPAGWWSALEPTDSHRASVALSDRGSELREVIEAQTDRAAVYAYETLGEEGCAELRNLARPFSRTVVDAAGFGF